MAGASEGIKTDIDRLKATFGTSCRIIDNIGEFLHVIVISFDNWDVKLKFQVTAGYPVEPAGIVVTGVEAAGSDMSSDLYVFLTNDDHLTHNIAEGAVVAKCWLETHGIPSTGIIPSKVGKGKPTKKKKKKTAMETDEITQKKPPMKTADDVIKRILWDDKLKPEDFVVGYLDRFLGVLEENFATFSWEDVASVDDYTEFAIPRHRIQYFKYQGVVVWDKSSRLDNVFGSTGSEVTILDIAQTVNSGTGTNSRIRMRQNLNYGDCDWNDQEDSYEYKVNHSDNGECEHEDDDDDDDDIVVNVGNIADNTQGASHHEHDGCSRIRPNYFICHRITNPQIIAAIESMQESILEREPNFAACCIRPSTLHLTLCTVGLDTDSQVADACAALRDARDELAEMAERGIEFHVNGIDNFYSRVIYGRVERKSDFDEFVGHVRAVLSEAGVDIRDGYDFVPHVTVLKMSRALGRDVGRNKVPAWMHENYRHLDFGTQKISSLDLCAMTADRVDDFYVTPLHLDLIDDNS